MAEDRNTKVYRDRVQIAVLDMLFDAYKSDWSDAVHYDQRNSSPEGHRVRSVAWKFGKHQFLANYYELDSAPGMASFRFRHQVSETGQVHDNWSEIKTRGEFEDLLRHVRAERGYTAGDLKAIKNVNKHKDRTPNNLILVGYTGSHAYGLNHNGFVDAEGVEHPPSDEDIRGAFALKTNDLLSLSKFRGKDYVDDNSKDDTKYDEVERFIDLCLKANPERLEMLASKKTLITPEGQMLVDIQKSFLSKRVIKTYGGYATSQLKRVERNKARSTKPAMHLLRLMLTGIHILKHGEVNPDMSAYRDRLLAIRFGYASMDEVFEWFGQLEKGFAEASEKTHLPDQPDYETVNKILLEIRQSFLYVKPQLFGKELKPVSLKSGFLKL